MPSDYTHDNDFPDDPFEVDVPDFENFTGPYADKIRMLTRTFAAAKVDFMALVQQSTFRELGIAVSALDEEIGLCCSARWSCISPTT